MAARLLQILEQQFFDNNGNPLSGGKVYSYVAGSSTPLVTYTDSTGNTPNANPVILDAYGRASIWLGSSLYKFVLTDSNGVTIQSQDNVTGNLTAALDGVAFNAGGSHASPLNVVAASGVTYTNAPRVKQYIQGSGGAVTVTANPQVQAGATEGQELLLVGCSNTNTVTLSDGTGLLLNGPYTMIDGSMLLLNWDNGQTKWVEVTRNNI